MWRFKPFAHKEQNGLEGRTIDIANVKVQVRNVIAEGGFSCVYLARDVLHASKQYALKHIICNDEESLELVRKEISVMISLKGHPNVVSLHAHTMLDMGRTKEALLVMEFCEKSLVNVLENRGAGYFEEKQILSIFRDVCNAVFAMHCQSPPIAHRDLKAENLLLGSDGLWKLCDFGSTSTNHKRFERPEEMGIEEDNIRKHTTPAYRAPEMWDLFRREVISEKVDIWALGCLLYRICYFKSAFDGESKLQVLNGNYRIPQSPKYSSSITDLIRDMLQESPDARPDITQVWFRVNEQLPIELQKPLPDAAPDTHPQTGHSDASMANAGNRTPPRPHRSPPSPPLSREQAQNVSPPSLTSKAGGAGGQLGAFWSTQHANDSPTVEDKRRPISNEEASKQSTSVQRSPENHRRSENNSPLKEQNVRSRASRNMDEHSVKRFDEGPSKDFEIRFDDADHGFGRTQKLESSNETFNTFVAEFDTGKLDSANNSKKSEKEEALEAEVDKLKDQLKQANVEKAEIMSKYEKLTAICRSQRQEIQELKQALAAGTPSLGKSAPKNQTSPGKGAPKNQTSPGNWQSSPPQQSEKVEGTVWELQQGMVANSSPNADSKSWQAFSEESRPPQASQKKNNPRSVRTGNGNEKKQASPTSLSSQAWGFETESFKAAPTNSQISRTAGPGSSSQRFGDSKGAASKKAAQPAGWAGF